MRPDVSVPIIWKLWLKWFFQGGKRAFQARSILGKTVTASIHPDGYGLLSIA